MEKLKDRIVSLRKQGKTYNEISSVLGCAKSTVSFHLSKLDWSDKLFKEKSKTNIEKRKLNSIGVENYKKRIVKPVQDKICPSCLSPFKTNRSDKTYCSKECCLNQILYDKCPGCGNRKQKKSKSCINCCDKGMPKNPENSLEKTIEDYENALSAIGKHPSWKHAHIRSLARQYNKDMKTLPCYNCGYSIHVEICHIIPISSFSKDTKIKVVNARTNLVQLCRNCHYEFDHDLLTL
jgi:5-methylcytosine-specific restriction endonuclease McrA